MAALVSIDDFAVITGQTLDGPATTRVTRLIEMASDSVLTNAHGQDIALGDSAGITLNLYEGVAYFPQRPVVAVTRVLVNGIVVDPSTYRFEPGGNRLPGRLIHQINGHDAFWAQTLWPWGYDTPPPWAGYTDQYQFDPIIVADYSHGWDPVPGPIVAAVTAMVVAVAGNNFGPTEVMESAGSYHVKYETNGQPPDMSVTPSTQAVLDQLCGVDGFGTVPIVGGSAGHYLPRAARPFRHQETWCR